jgi:Yip1 domain
MTESAPTPTPTGPEPGAFARMSGVLFAPGKTFESIGRRPGKDWLVPIGVLILLTIIGALFINPKLDTDTALREAKKRMEARNMPEAQREKAEQMMESQFNAIKSGPIRFVLGPVFVLLPLFFVSAVYLGIARAMGAGGRYKTILTGYAFAQVPQIIKGMLGLAIGFTKTTIDLNEVEHIVKSNVGSFLDAESTSKPVMAMMNAVDLFEIWGVVLCSIMLSRTTKLSKNAATIAVVGLWILFVLMKAGGAALGAAFGG